MRLGLICMLNIVIETELENVVDIRPGMPGMSASVLNSIELEPYNDARWASHCN